MAPRRHFCSALMTTDYPLRVDDSDKESGPLKQLGIQRHERRVKRLRNHDVNRVGATQLSCGSNPRCFGAQVDVQWNELEAW